MASQSPDSNKANKKNNGKPEGSSNSDDESSTEMKDAVAHLFPDSPDSSSPSAPPESDEDIVITVPGAILHLIDKQYSVELGCGNFSVIRLIQGNNTIAVLARVAAEIQWPLTRDQAAVKLDVSHYFFSFSAPKESGDDDSGALLNYGLTFASKGQEDLLKELDGVLESYCSFSIQKVVKNGKKEETEVLDGSLAKELSPGDLDSEKNREVMEKRCQAYWTTLAPNVEDYSSIAAKLVAAGSGQLIKGILWCGDVTVERLKWGNEVMKKKIVPGSSSEISPETLKKIKRVKKVSKMTERVAVGVLSGVLKVSGFFASSAANSKAGKKFFGLLPGEMVLASLDGFNRVCDAFEVAGRNVMSTSNTVTTELVSHKYGAEAAKATNESLDAAGHAMGAAWTVFKIRKAMNPKSVIRPSNLIKEGAKASKAEKKEKKSK